MIGLGGPRFDGCPENCRKLGVQKFGNLEICHQKFEDLPCATLKVIFAASFAYFASRTTGAPASIASGASGKINEAPRPAKLARPNRASQRC